MQPPHTFNPPVSVSVLALQNLSTVPFIRLALRPNPRSNPASPVSRRAKWLEHGVGPQTAFPAVALALLAEQLPAALASLIRPPPPKPPPKPSRSPPPPASLWVFGATPTLEHAKALLSDVFLVEEQGAWTAASPALHTHAFTTAIHRAIVLALQSQGALRVSNQVVHPSVRLSYSFSVSLSAPPESRIIIRVAVNNSKARKIADHDLLRDAKNPLRVITAPLGTPAVLSPRAPAGDALTESVLNRWREAGMYASGPSSSPDLDSSVVFVKFENGLEAPFPRAVVLTNEPLLPAEPIKLTDLSRATMHPKKSAKASNLWKSRKRPRSPSPFSPPVGGAQVAPPPPPNPDPLSTDGDPPMPFTDDAPTAHSINAVIRSLQQNGKKDSVPVMHHPLVEQVFTPILASSEPGELGAQNAPKEEPTIAQGGTATANLGLKTPQGQKNHPVLASAQNVKNEPSTFAMNTNNGLDSFPLDGDVSNGADFLHGGAGMGVTDFSTLDEVAEFFRDGMDDRLQEEEDNPAGNDNSIAQSNSENGQELTDRHLNDETTIPQFSKQGGQTTKMEVDSVPLDSSATHLGDKEDGTVVDERLATMSPTDLVRAAFKSFQSPMDQNKPQKEDIRKKLNTFFEDDFTERRRARLSTSQGIVKNRRLSKLYNPRSRYRLLKTAEDDDSKGFLRSDQTLMCQNDSMRRRKSLYIPRKKLKAFSRRRQRGEVKDTSFLRMGSKWEVSESDDEPEQQVTDAVKGQFSSAKLLSLDDLDRCIEKGDNQSTLGDRNLETDALKLADSVAIDCASACYVLSADKIPLSGLSPSLNENSLSQSSLHGVREEDQKPISTVQMGPLASKKFPPHPSTKPFLPPIAGSPSGRSSIKRDGEVFNLMLLLEMQLFSMNELSLFRGNVNDPMERVSNDKDTDMVSSATMRRVLLGLPRALETSHVFKTCLESLGCGPKLSENTIRESCLSEIEGSIQNPEQNTPSVLGPLSINEYMGKSATVFPLNPPKVCVGYNKEWMETFGGALPTWEKAGFEPYSERKNVEYVAIAPEDIQQDVDVLLRDVSSAYEECSFGTHTLFPFERVAFIANSVVDTASSENESGTSLSEAEKAMTEQYQLYVKALCTKLASLTREGRKNKISAPTNIVAYVISPFEKKRTAANVALLRAVSPLVNAVPDAIPSGIGAPPPIPNLPAAPWRASSSKGIVSLTVRVLPREVVYRNLAGSVDADRMSDRSLRPQLMKAISFAVFNSIRTKRVRMPSTDSDVASVLSRASLMPDDLMSPMTPDIGTESPGGTSITPVSPLGASTEEAVPHTSQVASQSLHVGHIDQSCALSPSFLYEPSIVLAGVGKHMGQTGARADIVLHLGYTFCDITNRFVFAWTDQRGELLDIATVPVVRTAMTSSRRKAFWGMWARGQRWRISYVDEVHVTVSRLGKMAPGELEDWDWVIGKVMSSKSSLSEKSSDEDNCVAVVRRFPPLQQQKSDDVNDVYTEFSTPATPGVSQPASSGAVVKGTPSMDVRMPPVCSVSVASVCNLETHLFLEESMDINADRRDFAIVGKERLSRGKNAQATAVLVRYERDGMKALEVNVLRHYGSAGHSEEMSDERSPWDSFDVQTVAHTIISNFHELRYTASPPCWPAQKWLSMYPVHMDAIRGYRANLRQVHRYGLGAHIIAPR
ncbi:Mediator complex subunit 13 [Gracilaria domingensis]|nr:Mediator complex subunit 13 [Gracilaria domingensis]